MPQISESSINWQDFDHEVADSDTPLSIFRSQLKSASKTIKARFKNGIAVEDLVAERATIMDQLLVRAWCRLFNDNESDIALIAVGGYGRAELHPASDIDLLILTTAKQDTETHAENIEQFLLFLWDMGLEVGHSVRTLSDCTEQAEADITIATNLMEARQLTGPENLFNEMKEAVSPEHVWPGLDFFRAKREEQIARHKRFNDTAYNLEPNIKENPGGLRDLQVIGWVAKRHFGAESLHELVGHGFLTGSEYEELIKAQNFLWKIRFALHILTSRREDRLLFDHQRTIATQFGYQDQEHKLAVEQFMKDYYRTVLELSRLNEMLLSIFEEKILYADDDERPIEINERFQSRHGILEATNNDIFTQTPSALLEIFVIMARNQQLHGVSANTIRLIRNCRYLIDDDFRHNPHCHELFIDLFRQGTGLTHELRRMNRYGVLAAYLPVFENIVGQMQHDLFHVYTVDEHTMFVVRNLRRFTVPEFSDEFPLCSRIINTIKKQEVLTIAGFFHDIAKGRGGNHSELGAVDAIEFCQEHSVSEHDTDVIKWLIENHLIMSTTAQRKDISDPEVITEFAKLVSNQERLDYIYLLTVADIRATSPSLWNSWKDSLLAELYHTTKRALRHGLHKPIEQENLVSNTQKKASNILKADSFNAEETKRQWMRLSNDYFLRYSADEVAWHTQAIIRHVNNNEPLILIRGETHRGGTEIFVYMKDIGHLFAIITATLEKLGLDIIDARIITTNDGYALDTFLVLNRDGQTITESEQQNEITNTLKKRLTNPEELSTLNSNLTRQLKHFPIKTRIFFREDANNNRTEMEVTTGDRPGLLARISTGMIECNVLLQNAKI
ncbi:MAG: [protein-PII] uridylyltransferase, partial [Gammaproteobacteria bacterium]